MSTGLGLNDILRCLPPLLFYGVVRRKEGTKMLGKDSSKVFPRQEREEEINRTNYTTKNIEQSKLKLYFYKIGICIVT